MSAYTDALATEKLALQEAVNARRAWKEFDNAARIACDKFRAAERRASEAADARLVAMREEGARK